MKKLLLLFIFSIILSSAVFASSKAFDFTGAALQSVYKFDEAVALMRKSNDMEDKTAAAKFLSQSLGRLRDARSLIRPYVDDLDEGISRTASALNQGFEVFYSDAEFLEEVLEKAKKGEMLGEEEGINFAIEGEKRENDAYLNMGSALANYRAEGLSQQETRKLLTRISFLFGQQLKKYRFYPTEVTELTIGISALESRLQGKDIAKNPYFEMLMKGEKPFPKSSEK